MVWKQGHQQYKIFPQLNYPFFPVAEIPLTYHFKLLSSQEDTKGTKYSIHYYFLCSFCVLCGKKSKLSHYLDITCYRFKKITIAPASVKASITLR
jgi:hypothetical protein